MTNPEDEDDFDVEEFVRAATQAGNAFDQLRQELRSAAQVQRVPTPGTLIGGRYRVESAIGEGGFGSVYRVKHDFLGRMFAMKVLNSRIAEDPDWVARFHEEARATSLIGHENIVYVTDFGQDDTYGYYFVMEFLEGKPLDEVLSKEGQQEPERILRFVHAAASALGSVHELGIVHCDLKPSNVFVVPRRDREEQWKFLDFGTSTIVMKAVATEALYGTPRYMAPEQSVGLDVDARADQFSLACIVYEMLTGQTPWEVRNWLQAMPEARKRRPPPPPSEANPETPLGWDEVVLRALSVPIDERYPSIDAFARALEKAAGIEWTPAVDPLDVRRSSHGDLFERTHTAPTVDIQLQSLEESSVVVDLEPADGGTDLPTIGMTFKSRERLMREYRRNLAVGGLFVPSEDLLPLRTPVLVELSYSGGETTCRIHASVVGHETRREAGRGFGLAVDPRDRAALDEYLAEVRGPSLKPDDVLRVGRPPTESDGLSPGEVFVLSRVDSGIPLARLRSMCAGLPFDVDGLVGELHQKGLLVVRKDAPSGPSTGAGKRVRTKSDFDATQIEMVLERVDFHRHQANYLGAMDVLDRSLQVAPDVAVFHHRRAQLLMEFEHDYKRALESARRAVELSPESAEYGALLDSLQARAEALNEPAVELLRDWVAIDSVTGGEAAFLEALEGWFLGRGWQCERQTVEKGRWNLYVHAGKTAQFLYSTHVDTVPPFIAPRIANDALYGRGACDTKGGIVAMCHAGERLRAQGRDDFGYLFVVGEEVDHCGAKEARRLGIETSRIILCEPTENRVVAAQKGMVKLLIAARGKAAHSAYPDKGVSAVHRLLSALERIRNEEWPSHDVLGPTTINVGVIEGGVAANVFAPSAAAQVLIRTVSATAPLVERLLELCGDAVHVEIPASNDPVFFDPPDDVDTCTVAFNTDATYLTEIAPVWLVGPGDIQVAHSDHEHITFESLDRGIDLYADLGRRCLS